MQIMRLSIAFAVGLPMMATTPTDPQAFLGLRKRIAEALER